MAGDFSHIYLVLIPSRAAVGENVDIDVYVRNLLPVMKIFIAVIGYYKPDLETIEFSPRCILLGGVHPDCPLVPGDGSQTFTASFPMPDHDIEVKIQSHVWLPPNWPVEEELLYDVLLEAVPPPPAEFTNLEVAQYV